METWQQGPRDQLNGISANGIWFIFYLISPSGSFCGSPASSQSTWYVGLSFYFVGFLNKPIEKGHYVYKKFYVHCYFYQDEILFEKKSSVFYFSCRKTLLEKFVWKYKNMSEMCVSRVFVRLIVLNER